MIRHQRICACFAWAPGGQVTETQRWFCHLKPAVAWLAAMGRRYPEGSGAIARERCYSDGTPLPPRGWRRNRYGQ